MPFALLCVTFPVMAKQQDVVSLDPVPWAAARVMLFHATHALSLAPASAGLLEVASSLPLSLVCSCFTRATTHS